MCRESTVPAWTSVVFNRAQGADATFLRAHRRTVQVPAGKGIDGKAAGGAQPTSERVRTGP
jgi:hypothetical protein